MIRSASVFERREIFVRLAAFRKRIQRAPQCENTLLNEVDDIGADARPAIARLSDDLVEGTRNTCDAIDTCHRRAAAQRVQAHARASSLKRICADHIGIDETFFQHLQV